MEPLGNPVATLESGVGSLGSATSPEHAVKPIARSEAVARSTCGFAQAGVRELAMIEEDEDAVRDSLGFWFGFAAAQRLTASRSNPIDKIREADRKGPEGGAVGPLACSGEAERAGCWLSLALEGGSSGEPR